MGDDTINPFFGISKELNVQFCLGYDPMEFNESLRAIAEGDIDVTPMITGEVPLEGVADAFAALGHPDAHCKILVTPCTPPPTESWAPRQPFRSHRTETSTGGK